MERVVMNDLIDKREHKDANTRYGPRVIRYVSAKSSNIALLPTLAIMSLAGGSCAHTHPQARVSANSELNRPVESSVSAQRARWWPAVQRLGELANSSESLRDEIWTKARVNTLGMKFAEIPAGIFVMGPDRHRVFAPQVAHQVAITKTYFIGVTEVTNAQFEKLFPDYERDEKYSPDPDSPAVNITFDMAERFCRLLSEKEGGVYRLPTEAEWEYACRAGATSQFCFGDDLSKLSEFGWCDESIGRASRVATLKPNAWGIYDMHGNVIERISDWFTNTYYARCAAAGVVEDPKGPESGGSHVLRSVPWYNTNRPAWACTVRFPAPLLDRVPFDESPVKLSQMLGFRVVRERPE